MITQLYCLITARCYDIIFQNNIYPVVLHEIDDVVQNIVNSEKGKLNNPGFSDKRETFV